MSGKISSIKRRDQNASSSSNSSLSSSGGGDATMSADLASFFECPVWFVPIFQTLQCNVPQSICQIFFIFLFVVFILVPQLRLCITPNFTVPKRSFGVLQLSIQIKLLSNVPRISRQYSKFGYGKGNFEK